MKFLQRIPAAYRTAIAALALLCLSACEKNSSFHETIYSDRKVLILYSAGHNSLSSDNLDNLRDLILYSNLHTDDPAADAVIIFSHSNEDSQTPYLLYPHKNWEGSLVIDTLVSFSSKTISASAATLETVLTFVRDNFPADEYGLVFSSHGTGYVPAGYYSNSAEYENNYKPSSAVSKTEGKRVPSLEPTPVPGIYETDPLVRSIGQDYYSNSETYEINVEQFAEAIPMYLKYVVFDACLMAGIEIAYQLRDKVEWLIASPAEILAEGMDYKTMLSYLTARPEDDLRGFCENYYNYYNAQSGDYKSATISMTNCTKLGPLAEICKELFEKYRDNLDDINPNDIQPYYRYSYHWFFDMEDIVAHMGCTDEELSLFHEALEDCVVYKAATEQFLPYSGGFKVTNYSGLSMMLPNDARDYLKNYYKTSLDWNFATSLVE